MLSKNTSASFRHVIVMKIEVKLVMLIQKIMRWNFLIASQANDLRASYCCTALASNRTTVIVAQAVCQRRSERD